ncbi:MAG: hypothetical protein ACTHNK_08595 [Thermomicrobiales bacterium]|jgi:hypothetical protein|nr:hypothetical protein [Thermomicrobiales bacterium]
MPKRGQHDDSPGDARKPFSDVGGPAGKHAQSHDVRAEELTNPEGSERTEAEFAADLAPQTPTAEPRGHSHTDESRLAVSEKDLHERLPNLTDDELARLPVLRAGTALDQGGVYLDLNDPQRQPFKAIGGERAEQRNRYIAKHDVDYRLWNRLAGQESTPVIERPTTHEQTANQG